MGSLRGFIEIPREDPEKRPVEERIRDFREVYRLLPEERLRRQAARCMDCGIPFCHAGCPLGNVIPDFNDLVYRNRWRDAYERLRATNNFPEFTGRICPAPCESACVLGLIEPPVTIEQIEWAIIEHAFREGWVKPEPPAQRTGKRIAVIGSGPAGLACADQLNRAGHWVTVFERDDRLGGLLRYGVPDFKMEKWVIDRRIAILEAEGISFRTGVHVGRDYPVDQLCRDFDAVVICTGATQPRDVRVPGRELKGIHFAWEYLWQATKRVARDDLEAAGIPIIDAKEKHVVVIGGGDTASDCIGVANRQGARTIVNFHIWPAPPSERTPEMPWPFYPHLLHVSTSHEEGCERVWSVETIAFEGSNGHVERVITVDVEAVPAGPNARRTRRRIPGTERVWPADLVLIAIGYEGPERSPLLEALGVELDSRGNVKADAHFQTNVPGVFVAGDAHRGASLVVWAISEGREAARAVDLYLMGHTSLPTKGEGDLPLLR